MSRNNTETTVLLILRILHIFTRQYRVKKNMTVFTAANMAAYVFISEVNSLGNIKNIKDKGGYPVEKSLYGISPPRNFSEIS